jgi:hypothetical protein
MHDIDFSSRELVDYVTEKVLALPQADAPVAHYFAPGLYIREVVFPSGIFAIGHKQRFEQFNIFLQGKIAMVGKNGKLKELTAPMVFVAPSGQKMGYVIETVVWLNIYPNPDNQTDIDVLENRYLDKSGPWKEKEEEEKQQRSLKRQVDRDDFTESDPAFMDSDQNYIDLPPGLSTVLQIRKSDIAGHGIFASWPFETGMPIGPYKIGNDYTKLARYINHAKNPNSKLIALENGDIMVLAVRTISGCKGGDQGEEITINYKVEVEPCQQQLQPPSAGPLSVE